MKFGSQILALGMLVVAVQAQGNTLRVKNVDFIATANLKGIEIRGTSTTSRGQATLTGGKLVALELTVPVDSLSTGMKMRDRHMKERVFKMPDESVPDINFSSTKIECVAADKNENCTVDGTLKLHGVSKAVQLKITKVASGKEFDLSGKAAVKLTDFGITPPSQLGVTVQDEVHIEAAGVVEAQ